MMPRWKRGGIAIPAAGPVCGCVYRPPPRVKLAFVTGFSRLRASSPKNLSVAVLLAALLLELLPAQAAAARRPRPVLLKAPHLVDYRADFRIVGELRGGRRGQEVLLKRRLVGIGRDIIRRKEVRADLKVKFFLKNVTRSANYRLVFRPRHGRKRVSKAARVNVRPDLYFDVEPNDVKGGRRVTVSGTMHPRAKGRVVRIEMRIENEWELIRKVDVSDGVFSRRFRPKVRGRREMRALFLGDELSWPTKRKERLWVYRRAEATWYGPGFWGETTACGQTLRRRTLGVAHRTLPCGTLVDFLYRGRTISVKVIDRGPFGEADWDLTKATKDRLHFEGRDEVGFIAH